MSLRTAPIVGAVIVAALHVAVVKAGPPAELQIPGQKIYPESITSRADGTILIGSIGRASIFRLKPGASSAEPWITAQLAPRQGIFGVFADERSGTLWACASTPGGAPGAAPPAQSELHTFDLKTGAPKAHYPLPTAGAFCNDIAIGSDGTAYVTDSNNMEVARLRKGAKALEAWAGDGAFGPKGGVLDGISVLGKRVLVNTLGTAKLFAVPIQADGGAGAATEIKLDRAIGRPDGMRTFGKNELLLIESAAPGRLSRVSLSDDTAKVDTVKEGYPQGPVSVTVVGTTAYVLEGQLAILFGRAPPDTVEQPYHATAVEVGRPAGSP
jgi:sugar lactone lactonase YvrE